jgi:hypothetical protein
MTSTPSRSAGVSGRALASLAALAVALSAAFVVGPPALAAMRSGGGYGDERQLAGAVREAFVEYWRLGDRDFSPGLRSVVDYWFRFHVAKGAIAAALLVVLIVLGALLWKAFLRAGGLRLGRRVALASAGVLVTMLALFSLLVVMANAQGAVAPFASLLPMLMDGGNDAEVAGTLAQVKQGVAAAGPSAPALEVISDFTRYHVAMVVIAAIVALAGIAVSVVLWKRVATASDRRTRRVVASFGVLTVLVSLAVAVVAAANATTAADPGPALLAWLDGGW